MEHITIGLICLLFVVALVAGLLDTLAGGGGLITLPVLMLSGVNPLVAIGTNKLQGAIGTATASFILIKKRNIHWPTIKPLMLPTFIGASLGSIAVLFINTSALSFLIPLVLACIAIIFLVSPTPKVSEPQVSYKTYKSGVLPCIGFYDGMFGPGTGSFFALANIKCRGYDLVVSTAMAKPLNFSTNLASLLVFIATDNLLWSIGLLMMLGQFIGAWLGSHLLFKINPIYLRVLIVLMSSCMLIKYLASMD
ncbi:TSUP family transporter [Paraglaciecola sp. 2405UD69-4]|uniref:TSUP family transporter n=1 Tax=Paraglaciecola sp. 2405UD69-4 TaxID=3391836 RepID=UPI0039C934E1